MATNVTNELVKFVLKFVTIRDSMHDFHLANEIVKIAKEHAQKHGLSKVAKIVVELGDIVEHGESISPENLKYNINLLMPCEVEVRRIRGDEWRLADIEGINR